MKRTLLVILLLALSPCAVVAQAAAEAKKDDPFWHWRTKGNTWTFRTVKTGAEESVGFVKYEITAVAGDEATFTMSYLNHEMELRTAYPNIKLELKTPPTENPKAVEEEVSVNALGKVKALKAETKEGSVVTTTWTWRSIEIKRVVNERETKTVRELWEAKIAALDLAKPDPHWFWKAKGKYWTCKSISKALALTSYTKVEITAFAGDEATYTETYLDKDMKELHSRKDQKFKTAEPPAPAKGAKVSIEEVECNAWGKVGAERVELNNIIEWRVNGFLVRAQNNNTGDTLELWETNLEKPK